MKANGHSKPKANGASKPRAEKDKDEDEDIRRNNDPAGTYDYLDATGALAVQVLRFHWDHGADGSSVLKANGKLKKTFSQRRPDPDEAKLWVVGVTAGEYLRRGPGHDWDRFSDEKWAGLPAATRQRKTIADSVKAVPARLNHRELDKCAPARSPVAGLEPDRVPPITR